MGIKDFVTYQQEPIMLIKDTDEFDYEKIEIINNKRVKKIIKKKIIDFYLDNKIESILVILRSKPQTLEEITSNYNSLNNDTKKKITIYKYLQDAIKAGLIKQVGKRLTQGSDISKIVTDTLYGRTAKLYYLATYDDSYWDNKENEKHIEKLAIIFKYYYENPNISSKNVGKLLKKIFSTINLKIGDFLVTNADRLTNLFMDNPTDMFEVLRTFNLLITVLNYHSYETELNEFLK